MFLPNPPQSFVEKIAESTTDKDHLYMKATIGMLFPVEFIESINTVFVNRR